MTALTQQDIDSISLLFTKAASNLNAATIVKAANAGKAFEMYALALTLRFLRKGGYAVSCVNAGQGKLTFPGGPSVPNPASHTYFTAFNGNEKLHIWVGIETLTLSYSLFPGAAPTFASYHEIDIGVYNTALSANIRPDHSSLVLAVSCKFADPSKAQLREALGFRRETAMYSGKLEASRAPWIVPALRARPAIPVVLFSRDPGIAKYSSPVDRYGLYVRALKYSI